MHFVGCKLMEKFSWNLEFTMNGALDLIINIKGVINGINSLLKDIAYLGGKCA